MITPTSTHPSEDLLHNQTCGLEESGHEIKRDFVDILYETVEQAPINMQFFATGCGSCMPAINDGSGVLFYIAQGQGSEKLGVKYDIVEHSSEGNGNEAPNRNHQTTVEGTDDVFDCIDLAELLIETASKYDVKTSWTGSIKDSVFLGSDMEYFTFDPGTKVEHKTRNKTGITVEAKEEDFCPDGSTKVDWEDGVSIVSSDRLTEA
jgi:thiol-disulfide isomerase/thioredoxin